jgi:adenosylcobinamide-GDP ribazoletransferase
MIQKEVRYFFTALMFFTRIPCPSWTDYSEEYLNKSRKYFPFIGWIVGGFAAFIFLLSKFVFSSAIAVILSMIATILLTGAFHEDGFADVCDGFGGGWTKEKIMTIMKDSRIGAYGAIGIVLLLGLKFLILQDLATQKNAAITLPHDWLLLLIFVNAHTISRFIASTFAQTHEYVQDIDKSKSKPIASAKLSTSEMTYSFIFVAIPLFFLLLFGNWLFIFVLPISYLAKMYLANYFSKYIGGYTGDCLGATQQVSEIVFYLSFLGLCKLL